MYSGCRNEADLVAEIVRALDDASPKPVTPVRLSIQLGAPQWRIEELLSKHRDYFVRVGGGAIYSLNLFGPFDGSAGAILKDVERNCEKEKQKKTALFFIVAAILLLAIS